MSLVSRVAYNPGGALSAETQGSWNPSACAWAPIVRFVLCL